MAELVMVDMRRLRMRRGTQRRYIHAAHRKLRGTWGELARLLRVSARTLRSWRDERFFMTYSVARLIKKKTGLPIPAGAIILPAFWAIKKAARMGGLATYRRYHVVGGDPEKRRRRWYVWWNTVGKYQEHPILSRPLPIRRPPTSIALAEWIGIMLGDGGITDHQVTITLNSRDDREYIRFVVALVEKLFRVQPHLYHDPPNHATDIVISRIGLVRFCTEKLGLVRGNKVKQRVDVPSWIMKNDKFVVACTRGLIDTDGSIYTHRYQINRKWYQYKKLAFTSYSSPLLRSVFRILKRHGLKPHYAARTNVRLEDTRDVARYMEIFSSHNPKHLKRYAA